MSTIHVKYLLVGGGLASVSAAEEIRRRDPEGTLLLIGLEALRPYRRSPLSKGYLRRAGSAGAAASSGSTGASTLATEKLLTHPPEFFAASNIQLRTGRRASVIDAARHRVTLDDGTVVAADRILLAVGSLPRHLEVPGADLPGLMYIRTIEDADRLRIAVEKALREGRPFVHGAQARRQGRVAIVGGGLLGVELAASLTEMGLLVQLIHDQPHPWSSIAGDNLGRAAARLLSDNGVALHLGSPVVRLEGDGRVQRVVTASGDIVECDFAVGAVGSIANRELLRNTPIAAEKAILVDQHCQTNIPGLFAAGDCCALFDPRFGKHVAVDHAAHAQYTGALAGYNMTRADDADFRAFDSVVTWSTQAFDTVLYAFGHGRFVDRRIIRGGNGAANGPSPHASASPPTAGSQIDLIEFGVDPAGRIAQILCLRSAPLSPADAATLERLVATRRDTTDLESTLRDPGAPIEGLAD